MLIVRTTWYEHETQDKQDKLIFEVRLEKTPLLLRATADQF